jgi:hypothetical protein
MNPRLILTAVSVALTCVAVPGIASAQKKKPNIVVIWGDDIGQSNISAYSHGLMGYRTPNIDRVAREGVMFTDYYAEQSCTAGRASFITGELDPTTQRRSRHTDRTQRFCRSRLRHRPDRYLLHQAGQERS